MGIRKNLFVFSLLMVTAVNCLGAGGIGKLVGKSKETIADLDQQGAISDLVEKANAVLRQEGSGDLVEKANAVLQEASGDLVEKDMLESESVEQEASGDLDEKDNVQCAENCGSGASCLKLSGTMTTIMIVLSALAAYI